MPLHGDELSTGNKRITKKLGIALFTCQGKFRGSKRKLSRIQVFRILRGKNN